jgi:hypothetical protein
LAVVVLQVPQVTILFLTRSLLLAVVLVRSYQTQEVQAVRAAVAQVRLRGLGLEGRGHRGKEMMAGVD